MKVWCVFGGEYEQWYLAGVFSSLEKAREYCAKHKSSKLYVEHEDEGEILDEATRY